MRLCLIILATIAIYLAMHHLLLAVRRKDRVCWWFSVLALALGAHNILLLVRIDVAHQPTHILLHKLQWATEILGLWLLQAFMGSYSRLNTRRLLAFTGVLVGGFFIWNLVRPYGMSIWGEPKVILKQWPWGGMHYGPITTIGPDYKLFMFLIVLVLGSCLWMGYQGWKLKHYQRSLAMLAALSLIVISILHSVCKDIFGWTTPPMIDMSFVGLLILMSFILSDEVVQASLLKKSLEKSEKNLKVTLNAIAEAVIVTDQSGLILNMNPAAQRMMRVSDVEGESTENYWQIYTHETDSNHEVLNTDGEDENAQLGRRLPAPAKRLNQVDGILRTEVMLSLAAHPNHLIHATETAASMYGEDGKTIGIVTVYHDQTDRVQMEDRLRHGQKLEALGQLAGGVAHDFNNMLGGIIGAAELLQDSVEGQPDAEEYVSLIMSAADHAADLTNQLLAFSRKGKQLSTLIDLHEILDSVVRILSHSIDRRVRIKTIYNAPYASVVGDPTQMQNTLINLGINSRDAMPAGGELLFQTDHLELDEKDCDAKYPELESGTYLSIKVVDQGMGISPQYLSRIFEPFFTTKEEGKGTGLGLAAVYGTIRNHGGSIDVASQVSNGTTFTLLLPLSSRTRPSLPTHQPKPRMKTEMNKGMVLLVDDEGLLRHTGARLLEGMGYEVMQAADGKQGLIAFEKYYDQIQFVILDMVMPEMSGEEAYRKMRDWECTKHDENGEVAETFDRPKRRPILMCSGFARNTSISHLMEIGLDGFIQKPFRRMDLVNAIEKLLSEDKI